MGSLQDNFNGDYRATKENDFVLKVKFGGFYYYYDFMARVMISSNSGSNAAQTILPFSQLDRETLDEFRGKLKQLGGRPPELPPEAPATPVSPKGLTL